MLELIAILVCTLPLHQNHLSIFSVILGRVQSTHLAALVHLGILVKHAQVPAVVASSALDAYANTARAAFAARFQLIVVVGLWALRCGHKPSPIIAVRAKSLDTLYRAGELP